MPSFADVPTNVRQRAVVADLKKEKKKKRNLSGIQPPVTTSAVIMTKVSVSRANGGFSFLDLARRSDVEAKSFS